MTGFGIGGIPLVVDMRVHILTLVAVFLSLGLGVLIGTTLPDHGPFLDQQEKIIAQLEAEFEKLQHRNLDYQEKVVALQGELESYQRFLGNVLPLLVEGRLDGKRIAVVRTGPEIKDDDILSILELAGAKVSATVTLTGKKVPDRHLLPGKEEAEANPGRQGAIAPTAWEGHLPELARGLIKDLTGDGEGTYLELSRRLDLVRLGKGNTYEKVDMVLVLGGGTGLDKGGAWGTSLMRAFIDLGLPVITAHRGEAPRDLGIQSGYLGQAVVDRVSTVPGKVTLVYTLGGIRHVLEQPGGTRRATS
mgnify:CR=1 FL=1